MSQTVQEPYCFSFLAVESQNFDKQMAVHYICMYLEKTTSE